MAHAYIHACMHLKPTEGYVRRQRGKHCPLIRHTHSTIAASTPCKKDFVDIGALVEHAYLHACMWPASAACAGSCPLDPSQSLTHCHMQRDQCMPVSHP